MNKLLIIILGILPLDIYAQPSEEITLQEVMNLAQKRSLEAIEAKNKLHIASWQFKNYKANLCPQIVLEGSLPNLNKSYTKYQNDDGTYKFVTTSILSENLTFSINQQIPFSGGSVSLQSNLERMDQIGDSNSKKYFTIPVLIVLSQPLFAYNSFKWDRRIEPLKLLEAQKQYQVDIEAIYIKAINYYFDLLLAQINENIAQQTLENAKKLFEIAEGKKNRGLIDENEYQQLRLNYINASASIIEVHQNYERKIFQLCSFLCIKNNIRLIPIIPKNLPKLNISFEEVLRVVKNNNPFMENVKRRRIEVDKSIAQVRAERRPKIDAYFSLGYSGTNSSFAEAYQDLQNRQVVSVGVKVPILDWGKSKGKIEIAKYQKELEEGKIRSDISNFEQEVKILVNKILNQKKLIDIYKLADTIAQNRYKIAYETFIMGKISVLDINSAQIEKDNAKRNYLNQVYNFWLLYYQLRQLSLYDFIEKKSLIEIKTEHYGQSYTTKSN